jgi:hypothetical protein
MNDDVLADKDPAFRRINFCSVIRGSAWKPEPKGQTKGVARLHNNATLKKVLLRTAVSQKQSQGTNRQNIRVSNCK